MAAPDGLSFAEMRANANACLSEALDWLHAEWDPQNPPTVQQRQAWEFARKCAANAHRALLHAARSSS